MKQVQDALTEKTLTENFTKAELVKEILRLRECQENQAKQIHSDQRLIDSMKYSSAELLKQKVEEIQTLQVRCNRYYEESESANKLSARFHEQLQEARNKIQELDSDKRFLQTLISKSNIDERRHQAFSF